MFAKKTLSGLLFAVIGLVVSPALFAGQYLGEEVREVPFTIAGGQVVKLPMTKSGAVPAQKDGMTVHAAGLMFNFPKDKPGYMELAWGYTVEVPEGRRYSEILIENVSGEQPVLMLRQAEPKVAVQKLGAKIAAPLINLDSKPVAANKENTPWA